MFILDEKNHQPLIFTIFVSDRLKRIVSVINILHWPEISFPTLNYDCINILIIVTAGVTYSNNAEEKVHDNLHRKFYLSETKRFLQILELFHENRRT
jgi:hypothetical protein